MQTSVVALLFVTSSVILASIVVEYAVVTCEQAIDTDDAPQIDRIRELESLLLNQTDSLFDEIEHFNQTATQPADMAQP